MDIDPEKSDRAAASSKMPKLLKLGHNMTSGGQIPSNIHVIERPQDKGSEQFNFDNAIARSRCSSPCVKSTENFIIQNKALGTLKNQSSAFVSKRTTPESSPRQKYLTPASQSMGKISLSKGSSYSLGKKDANNILRNTNNFILIMRHGHAHGKLRERKQEVPLLRVSSLENKKTSFVINPKLGSTKGGRSMNPQRVASPINVKSLDKCGDRTPTQSNAGRSAKTKKRKASSKSRSIYTPSPQKDRSGNGADEPRQRPLSVKKLFSIVNDQKSTPEEFQESPSAGNSKTNETRKVRLIMSPVHFDEKGILNPRLGEPAGFVPDNAEATPAGSITLKSVRGSSNDGVADNGLRFVSQSPISSVSELFRTANVSSTRACSPFQIVKNVNFDGRNISSEGGHGGSAAGTNRLTGASSKNTGDNSNSFLTVKEINRMVNSPAPNAKGTRAKSNPSAKRNSNKTKKKENKRASAKQSKKKTAKSRGLKKETPTKTMGKKASTATKKKRSKATPKRQTPKQKSEMPTPGQFVDDLLLGDAQHDMEWRNDGDNIDTSFSNIFDGFGVSPEKAIHGSPGGAREFNNKLRLEFDDFDFEPFDNLNEVVFNDLV